MQVDLRVKIYNSQVELQVASIIGKNGLQVRKEQAKHDVVIVVFEERVVVFEKVNVLHSLVAKELFGKDVKQAVNFQSISKLWDFNN